MLFQQPEGERLPKEVALNQRLVKYNTCPYIVQMYDWFLEDRLIMVMEYPRPCKTLSEFISPATIQGENLPRQLMRQAVTAAKYCIDQGVNHADLSLYNVLINTETMHLKCIDFGIGQLISAIHDLFLGYCGEFLC